VRRLAAPFTLSLLLLAAAAVSQAETAEPVSSRCRKDALDAWYCAKDPRGVAVVDGLGKVACAAGQCVRVGDEWHCSSLSGGAAVAGPGGLRCDGGCQAPRAVDCDLNSGPAREN